MFAQVSNLKPGVMNWSLKDAHIYVNQIEGIKEQIRREEEEEDYPAPNALVKP